MANRKQNLGDYGENQAVKVLEQKHYTIVETNWYCRYGELDIIARYGDIWVFVEVKTQRGMANNPLTNITPQKQEKLTKAVFEYLSQHDLDDVIWRIDAIAVKVLEHQVPIIEHVEDALGW